MQTYLRPDENVVSSKISPVNHIVTLIPESN